MSDLPTMIARTIRIIGPAVRVAWWLPDGPGCCRLPRRLLRALPSPTLI